ncbi:M20 family metallopeptidase [Sphaerisporangium rubeum]|uniref:Glutamate carboxypeptidase n=1 Tax=Sphaerisporangium rubeum TaxID=321317 RepID=A0A7X0I9G6_9ACTN|nr:M20 family metallopeptidase [Sphaerisporangium rubeum]MBB6471074.1 glutamate carboxypeptidase [Sphaerisporangium rubeum]
MLRDLEVLVGCESFSADLAAVARSAEVVGGLGRRLLGVEAETVLIDGVSHLRWCFGTPRVLLLGHHDTVWPLGTLERKPWSVVDGVARGPGVFDMKAGLVQMFHAVAGLPSRDGVCVLVTGDEELGSPTSRGLIEETARECVAAFVMEASADGGTLKVARKGTSNYELVVHGRGAHAGLEPAKGVNAAVELAHQVLALDGLAERVNGAGMGTGGGYGNPKAAERNPDPGTGAAEGYGDLGPVTVTPTVLSAGTTSNTVPASGRVAVDVRVPTVAAQLRVDELIRGLRPQVEGTRLEVLGGPNRPPLEPGSSAELFALAQRVAAGLGLPPLRGAGVGGASDGNFTAGVGCPTLDGLGAVGGGAHAESEHVVVAEMPRRAALLRGLIEAVCA